MTRHRRLVGVLLIALITLQSNASTASRPRTVQTPPVPVHMLWLHVDPLQPRSLYVGGVLFCADSSGNGCFPWLMRSTDGGETWSDLSIGLATAMGRANIAPVLVDNVFGAGASYGFVGNGIYRFVGSGPAQARLSISATVPAPTSTLRAVGAGTRPNDPIYLLAKGQQGNVDGVLYRSTDGGRTWTHLPSGVLPNLAPASTAPGELFVPQPHHTVAAPFVARYRTMSPYILGQPVTEAFTEGANLMQVFEHMILELHGRQVVVGRLPQTTEYFSRVSITAIRPDFR